MLLLQLVNYWLFWRVIGHTFLQFAYLQACPIIGEPLGKAVRALGTKAMRVLAVVSGSPKVRSPNTVGGA
jgi:hypothetical protein